MLVCVCINSLVGGKHLESLGVLSIHARRSDCVRQVVEHFLAFLVPPMLILHLIKLQIVLFLIEGLLPSVLLGLHADLVGRHFAVDLGLRLLLLFAVL